MRGFCLAPGDPNRDGGATVSAHCVQRGGMRFYGKKQTTSVYSPWATIVARREILNTPVSGAKLGAQPHWSP
jgi:hypothetical protein